MAAEVAFDVLEQILLRLDVKDIIRYKSVCKSWQSFLSTSVFVKAHLNYGYKNDVAVHIRRINCEKFVSCAETSFHCNFMYIVGSCNGLVCLSHKDVDLVVTNPCTRETMELKTLFYLPALKEYMIRQLVCCMGFGYDHSIYG